MFHTHVACYLGREPEQGFSGFVSEQHWYIILEIENGITQEEGRGVLSILKQTIFTSPIQQLADFELFFHETIKKTNLLLNASFASILIKDGVLYMKTMGRGEIFLRRGRQCKKIIGGEKIASGYIEDHDFFVLTTNRFVEVLGGEEKIRKIFNHRKPNQVVEELISELKSIDDQGIISLFLQLEKKPQTTTIDVVGDSSYAHEKKEGFLSKINLARTIKTYIEIVQKNFKSSSEQSNKKKVITLITVFLIFIVLVWSVGLGYKRRSEAEKWRKIQAATEHIRQKLQEAEDDMVSNRARSILLLSEAKEASQKLKEILGNTYEKEAKEVLQLIAEKELKILKKEEKPYEEFFDLSVEDKDAQGLAFSLSDANLSVFDEKGIIYTISLRKKSLEKKTVSEIQQSQLFSSYNNEFFVYRESNGIYKVDTRGAVKNVVGNDSEWGKINGLEAYGGNIYLLDTGKDAIYKYTATVSGYAEKVSYIKPDEITSLSRANSFTIDGSVYIALENSILKYTSGIRDLFKTSFPEKTIHLKKAYTSKSLDKVYAWDKQAGVVYILEKNGAYERQISSAIISKADDFIVYEDMALFLLGPKIYKITWK